MENNKAFLYSAAAPSESQRKGFISFLESKYNCSVELEWIEDLSLDNGFKLTAGNDVYDWSPKGLLGQLNNAISSKKLKKDNIIPVLKKSLSEW